MVLGKHQVWPQIPPAIQTGLPDLLLTCNSMKGNGGEIILKYSFKNLRNTIDKIRKKSLLRIQTGLRDLLLTWLNHNWMNGEGEDVKLHLEFEKYSFKNLRNTIYKIRNTSIFKADYETNYVIHISRQIKWRERGVGVILSPG